MKHPLVDFPTPVPAKGPIRTLFCCVGRRVELLQNFRSAALQLGRKLIAYGTDRSWTAPAMHIVDRAHISPPIDSPGYIEFLLRLVKKESVQLLVPLIDSDLLLLAMARQRFAAIGCTVLVSTPRVVAICRDKLLCYKHLSAANIDTPATWSLDEVLAKPSLRFPLYIKPRAGSAARGHFVCDERESLTVLARRVTDPIVQEYVHGTEFTLDAYAGFDGKPHCIVPRQRLEVRTGEVSKGCVVKDPRIIALGAKVIRSFRDCVGVITIQCIRSPNGRTRVIEINPRVGGGMPLSVAAGADFPRWILADRMGRPQRVRIDGFRNGLHMLRYDNAVYCDASRIKDRAR